MGLKIIRLKIESKEWNEVKMFIELEKWNVFGAWILTNDRKCSFIQNPEEFQINILLNLHNSKLETEK